MIATVPFSGGIFFRVLNFSLIFFSVVKYNQILKYIISQESLRDHVLPARPYSHESGSKSEKEQRINGKHKKIHFRIPFLSLNTALDIKMSDFAFRIFPSNTSNSSHLVKS